jgi:hypothetical protein
MNENAEFRFDFNKVGQGLFYSGNMDNLNFVYDCGSYYKEDFGRRIIGPYKRRTKIRSIDLLVISNFHHEHVNGLNSLLDGIKLKNVVIPYFEPIERLILALEREKFPFWYYFFLQNPVAFFHIKGADKIIVVDGERGKISPPPNRIYPRPQIDIHMSNDANLRKKVENNEHWDKLLDTGELMLKNHDGYITLYKWMFRFFNYKLNVRKRKLKKIKKTLEKVKIDPDNPDSLRSAITSSAAKRDIRRHYGGTLRGNLDNSSLVVYHGPTGEYNNNFDIYCEEGLSLNKCPHSSAFRGTESCGYSGENCMGQLLTGDAGLKYKRKYKELRTHFSNYFSTIPLSQIPYHGARSNWNGDILQDLKKCSYWVSSSRYPSFYGIPNSTVVLNILKNERCFCWSNQNNRFFIKGTVTWR